jgi:hypothetical protein
MSKRNHTKSYVFDETENKWEGFLYDRDCCSAIVQQFFPRGVITRHKANDPATVTEAQEEGRTIITSNGTDFVRYIGKAQKTDNNAECNDCWGMIWLPNVDYDRQNALERLRIERGLTFDGKLYPWQALGYVNLCIHVHRDGTLHVKRFKRCQFCTKAAPITEPWYQVLLTV